MILGRTPEGLIKIKKDEPLGLRAVNCACCGGNCLQLPSGRILIPSDPEFSKKLRGDPGVTAFTQVSLSYDVTTGNNGGSSSMSDSFNVAWTSDIACDQFNIKKFSDLPVPQFGFSECGFYFRLANLEIGTGAQLRNDNTLSLGLSDSVYGAGFGLLNFDCNLGAPENTGQASITINGESIPTQLFPVYDEWYDGLFITGNVTVVFS